MFKTSEGKDVETFRSLYAFRLYVLPQLCKALSETSQKQCASTHLAPRAPATPSPALTPSSAHIACTSASPAVLSVSVNSKAPHPALHCAHRQHLRTQALWAGKEDAHSTLRRCPAARADNPQSCPRQRACDVLMQYCSCGCVTLGHCATH